VRPPLCWIRYRIRAPDASIRREDGLPLETPFRYDGDVFQLPFPPVAPGTSPSPLFRATALGRY
jgi:hypothetical protein